MTVAKIFAAFGLPDSSRVERRVPKKLLLEHGAPTAADKRKINEGVEQLQWLSTLKPSTVGIAEYKNPQREYLEIAVLQLVLRQVAKLPRLVELTHRAVPYPVVLITEQNDKVHLSVAHKRWSQAESGKTVLDGDVVGVDLNAVDPKVRGPFLSSVVLGQQPRESLHALYQGWTDTLLAILSAGRTGAFEIPDEVDLRVARHNALNECELLEAEMARLRSVAAKEKQIPRQVELNLELKRLEAAHAEALTKL